MHTVLHRREDHIKRKNSQQCDHLSSHLCANLLSQSTTYTCKTISRKDRETTMFCKALIVRLFLPDAFYQLHCHDQTSATERMYNWNKQSTRPRKLCETQIFRLWLDRWKICFEKKVWEIFCWKTLGLCICLSQTVCVCVSLSFCKSPSWPLSSPDDKLSENIWFVWSRISYSGDEWRCYHVGQTNKQQ